MAGGFSIFSNGNSPLLCQVLKLNCSSTEVVPNTSYITATVIEKVSAVPTLTPQPTQSPHIGSSPTPARRLPRNYPLADQPIRRSSEYITRSGDCMSCIAYRAHIILSGLVNANPQINRLNRIVEGDIIHIP